MSRLRTLGELNLVYGRRRGRRLRPGRERLLQELLPKIAVTTSDIPSTPSLWFDVSIRDIWLEIGFGAGEHLAAQAAAHPDVGFIGCEPFRNGVAHLLARIDGDGLRNVRIYPDDARLLLKALPSCSIDRTFLLFPDPWPKTRHHRRRIIAAETLRDLSRTMKQGSELRLASDDVGYVRWMLYHTLNDGGFEWLAHRPDDWRRRPSDWPPTRYEMKALDRGDDCYFLQFCRTSSTGAVPGDITLDSKG